MLVEIPYSLVAGSIYYCCWWWGIFGTRVSGFTSGFSYLLILLFELYYVSFGQAIAAFAPNELLASLLVPVFFLFVGLEVLSDTESRGGRERGRFS